LKYLLLIFLTCLLSRYICLAQVYNKGVVYIPEGANAAAFGDLTNADSGIIVNSGNLYALHDIKNSGFTGYNGGTLVLGGQTAQSLTGSNSFYTSNLTINNTSGIITLSKRYSVSNNAHFITGIVEAWNEYEPLEFNPAGTGDQAIATTGASDSSHVLGYASQMGKGNFIYPVGDNKKYQPIAANLSTNTAGMLCNYMPSDAGNALFVTTGLSSTPLQLYNAYEHWNLVPAGLSTGIVTIYYDGYNDLGIVTGYDSALKVAHKVPAGWANEGGQVSGSQTEGTVTSIGEVSDWNIFTLGSLLSLSPLPTEVLDLTVMQNDCNADLSWNSGVEQSLAAYDVQYSVDGIRFKTIGSVIAQGSGSHYTFSYAAMNGRVFFRLALRSINNEYSYTEILMLNLKCTGDKHSVTIYPNPVNYGQQLHINLYGYGQGATGILYDIAGRQIYVEPLSNGTNIMAMDKIAVGTYQLCIVSAGRRETYKIVVTN
jgi:hypothetical protein